MALVQKTNASGSSTAPAITLTGVTAGNFLWFGIVTGVKAGPTSVTDSSGATPALAINSPYTLFGNSTQYYVANAAAGTHTFTANYSSAASFILFAAEYSGIATSSPLDGTPSQKSSSSGTAITTGSTTASVANDLVIVLVGTSGGSKTYSAWLGGVTQEDTLATGPSGAWADLIDTGTGAISSGATVSGSANWSGTIALFKAGSSTQSYSYTMNGGVVLSGAAPVALTAVRGASGGMTFGGAAPAARVISLPPRTGGVNFSGAVVPNYARSVNPSGGVVLGGAVAPGIERTVTASGGLTFGGSAGVIFVRPGQKTATLPIIGVGQ